MMKYSWLKLIFVVLLLQGCNYVEVNSEYDTGTNFRSLRTFNVQPMRSNDSRKVNEFDLERVQSAISSELKARGYTQTSSNADMSVEAHIVTRERRDMESTTTYNYGSSTTDYDVLEYTEGTLMIDIRDADSNKLIWHSVGIGIIDKHAKNKEERVGKAVAKIFAGFPVPRHE
jgi:hypothetical protein